MRTITLLHSGLEVPADEFIQVAAYDQLTMSDDITFAATIRIGTRTIGIFEQTARDPHPRFIPADLARFGRRDFERFADSCRMDGKPVTAHDVLGWLVDEYTTSIALGAQLERGMTLARQVADHRVLHWASVPLPQGPEHRTLIAARLHHCPDAVWQIWAGFRWETLSIAPST